MSFGAFNMRNNQYSNRGNYPVYFPKPYGAYNLNDNGFYRQNPSFNQGYFSSNNYTTGFGNEHMIPRSHSAGNGFSKPTHYNEQRHYDSQNLRNKNEYNSKKNLSKHDRSHKENAITLKHIEHKPLDDTNNSNGRRSLPVLPVDNKSDNPHNDKKTNEIIHEHHKTEVETSNGKTSNQLNDSLKRTKSVSSLSNEMKHDSSKTFDSISKLRESQPKLSKTSESCSESSKTSETLVKSFRSSEAKHSSSKSKKSLDTFSNLNQPSSKSPKTNHSSQKSPKTKESTNKSRINGSVHKSSKISESTYNSSKASEMVPQPTKTNEPNEKSSYTDRASINSSKTNQHSKKSSMTNEPNNKTSNTDKPNIRSSTTNEPTIRSLMTNESIQKSTKTIKSTQKSTKIKESNDKSFKANESTNILSKTNDSTSLKTNDLVQKSSKSCKTVNKSRRNNESHFNLSKSSSYNLEQLPNAIQETERILSETTDPSTIGSTTLPMVAQGSSKRKSRLSSNLNGITPLDESNAKNTLNNPETKAKKSFNFVNSNINADIDSRSSAEHLQGVVKYESVLRIHPCNSDVPADNLHNIANNVVLTPILVKMDPIPNEVTKGSVANLKRNIDSESHAHCKKRKLNHEDQIKELDSKIKINKVAMKDQRKLMKQFKKSYELELKKYNEFKTVKKSLLNKREEILKDLSVSTDDSSDDDDEDNSEGNDDNDVEIIDVNPTINVIEVDSSSEEESVSDKGEVEIVLKSCAAINEMDKNTNADRGRSVIKGCKSAPCSPTYKSQYATTTAAAATPSFALNTVQEPSLDPILISTQSETFVTDIKVSNNSLYVASSHGILRQFDLTKHECVRHYQGHYHLIHCILVACFPIGEQRLVSGGFDNKLLIHDVTTANILQTVPTSSPILSLCEIRNNVYAGCSDGQIFVYNLEKNAAAKSFRVCEGGLVCLSGTKDATRSVLFVGTNEGHLTMWDADKCVQLKNISVQDHKGIPIGFITLPQTRVLVYGKNNIHFLYYSSDKSPVTFNNIRKINSVCITKIYIIVGCVTGTIIVHRMKGSLIHKTPTLTFMNGDSPILAITFYNNTIISGDKAGQVYFNRLIEH